MDAVQLRWYRIVSAAQTTSSKCKNKAVALLSLIHTGDYSRRFNGDIVASVDEALGTAVV